MKKKSLFQKIVSAVFGGIVTFSAVFIPTNTLNVNAGLAGKYYDSNTSLVFSGGVNNAYIVGYTKDTSELIIPDKVGGWPVDRIESIEYIPEENIDYEHKTEGFPFPLINSDSDDKYEEIPANITKIVLPDTVEKVSESAFKKCVNLQEINVPSKITSIRKLFPENAIEKSKSSENGIIYINNVVYGYEKIPDDGIVVIKDGAVSIDNEAFKDCKELKKIILPEGLQIINDNAFLNCTNLEEVIIPTGVDLNGEPFEGTDTKKLLLVAEDLEKISNYVEYRMIKTESLKEYKAKQESVETSEENPSTPTENNAETSAVTVSDTETTQNNNSPVIIWGIIGGVLVIGIIIAVVIISKKKKS